MDDSKAFEFQAQAPPSQDDRQVIYANGISAKTGLPLCELDTKTAAGIVRGQRLSDEEKQLTAAKDAESETSFGVLADVDANDLSEAGWGIVFPAKASDDVKKQLAPLLEHRQRESGDLFHVFEGGKGYRPGESCSDWLDRNGAALDLVDPLNGVPFYLLLAGSPEEIPFEF